MTGATGLVTAAMDRLAAGWLSVQPGDYDPSSGHGPEWGKAAPAGLLIWLFMGAALFFLIKSMNRHMKRVPKSFDPAEQADAGETARTAGVAAGDGDAGGGAEPGGRAAEEAGRSRVTLPLAVPDSAAEKPE